MFEILEQYEKLHFSPGREQFLNTPLQIQDENGEWIDITAAITKEDTGREVKFDNGDSLKAADKHLIFNGETCIFLDSLNVGDSLKKANGETITVTEINTIPDTIYYDLTVDSETHLYQTANGLVHHNTETCRKLAEKMHMPLVRFDMSEYQEKHSVARLIGSPPGYVGFEDNAGQLITKLQENPHCVLLLDEIEKAHPDVTNIMLQFMDNGFVTGSNGKQADGRNCILIMTSNLGARDSERNTIGFGDLARTGEDDKAINEYFAPEFRNRLDAIIKFAPLEHSTVLKIVDKFIGELNAQLKDKDILIEIDETTAEWLAKLGYDKKMGARPLARVIDTKLKSPLSRRVLFGDLVNGGHVKVTIENDEPVFTVSEYIKPVVESDQKLVIEDGQLVLADEDSDNN